jgi:hypothetical protein
MDRTELEKLHGEALSTAEAVQKYEFIAFSAPFVKARRRADGCSGTLEFQHLPRFYFGFLEDTTSKTETNFR